MKLLIKNGRIVDPRSGIDEILDIRLAGGKIAEIRSGIEVGSQPSVDASGFVIVPGLIDMHVHLREPGFEDKETILSGTRAAAKGGFTSVCCMPNTNPVNDNRAVTEDILARAARTASVNIYPIASVTEGLKGEKLTDMEDLVRAGAVAFTDDGKPVRDDGIMKRALEESHRIGTLVIDHCEDTELSGDGVMHEGPVSARLGFKGIPSSAEVNPVARDIFLAEQLGARIHIAHLSVAGAVEAVREARTRGIQVSAEATPHHLFLTDSAVESQNADFKMNPPLRSRTDVETLTRALRSGDIDVIATDHAPHTPEEKSRGFEKAPFGVVGLESAVPLVLDRLVGTNIISLGHFVELLSVNPARLLGLENKGRIAEGADADLTLLSLTEETMIDKTRLESKSRNTPFDGWKLKGAAVMTIVGGRIVFPFDHEYHSSISGAE